MLSCIRTAAGYALFSGNDIELDMRRENPEKLFERFIWGPHPEAGVVRASV